MYTQCPECLTYFQVTPEHLKIAQGNVRCGQCRNVFSALGNLTEQPPASAYQPAPGISGKKNATEDIIEEEVAVNKARAKPAINKAKNGVRQNARAKAVNNLKKNAAIAKSPAKPTAKAPAKPQAKPLAKAKSKPKTTPAKPKAAPRPTAVKPLAVKTKANTNFKQKTAPKQQAKPVEAENKEENKSRLGQAIAAIKALNKTAPNKLSSLEAGRDSYIGKIKENIEKIELNIKKEVRKRVDLQYKKQPAKQEKPKKATKPTNKTAAPPIKPRTPPVAVAPKKANLPQKANFFEPQEAVDLDQVFQDIDNLDMDNNTPIINFETPSANIDTASPEIQKKTDIKVKSLSRNLPSRHLASQNQMAPAVATQGKSLAIIPKQLINDFKVIVEKNQPEPPNPLSTLWHVGSIALMLVFLIQTIYFKHNDLAKIPALRPWIESFCNQLACDLSLPNDINKLELLGQDIRSHPKKKKALLVSTTIINNARYTQSYPILEITFSNMNGQKVAMRRFLATEYLPAKTEIDKGMLPNTPIKIELGMLDPGADAVNFEFDFLPN